MSLAMAKRPSKDAETPKDAHRYALVSFRPPSALRETLQQLADEQRRSLSQICLLLVEEALTSKGLWPPRSQP